MSKQIIMGVEKTLDALADTLMKQNLSRLPISDLQIHPVLD